MIPTKEALRVMAASANVIARADDLIEAVMKDLGESPEALRGAEVLAETLRQVMKLIVGDEASPNDRQLEVEMQATGVAIVFIANGVHHRIRELRP
jgi:hypothetical protein